MVVVQDFNHQLYEARGFLVDELGKQKLDLLTLEREGLTKRYYINLDPTSMHKS